MNDINHVVTILCGFKYSVFRLYCVFLDVIRFVMF